MAHPRHPAHVGDRPEEALAGPPEPSLARPLREASRLLDAQPNRVYFAKELESFFATSRGALHLPSDTSPAKLITALLKFAPLRLLTLTPLPPFAPKPVTRYVWRDASPFGIGLSLKRGSYLSHGSAVFVNGLTQQVPKTIYVNKEQSPKPSSAGSLSQEAIDRAFQNQPRASKYQVQLDGYTATLLSGKNTGRLEVTQIEQNGERLDVTKVERTLIDIAVRPVYAGGVFEVLKAYEAARDRVSVNTLIATLKRLEYVYPYHQAIGFYMQRAGFPARQLEKLRSLGLMFNFYLTNRMPERKLNADWRLWVPEGL